MAQGFVYRWHSIIASPTHATSTDPHLNRCMNLSWTASCLPGTGARHLPLLRESCPSSPCVPREGARTRKRAWPANALTWRVSPEGVAPASARAAGGETGSRRPCPAVTQHRCGDSDCHFFLLSYKLRCAGSVAPAPHPSPPWATIAPSAKNWGVGRGSGNEAGPLGSQDQARLTRKTERGGGACLGRGVERQGLLYKVILHGGSGPGPNTPMGPAGWKRRAVCIHWGLPRMPCPTQLAWGRPPGLTPPTGANSPPGWSALRPWGGSWLPPAAPRLTKRCPAGPAATSSLPGARAGARAGPWARARAPRAGIRGAAC